MKKIFNGVILISLLAIGFSCEDTSLDPLQFSSMKKGTILALRGDALNNLYVKGLPVGEMFPRIINGTEKFKYETEILATDPSTIASVDLYVIKKTGATSERMALKNIPASAFTKGVYPNPSASVEIGISELLPKLGIPATYPLSAGDITTLLTTYKFGVTIESDINLTDGTKILAADIVASGLFQSNQFYPAMILTWAVTDYCPYTTDWTGVYTSTEVYSDGAYGPYDITLTAVGGFPNRFQMTNFWDSGITAYIEFTPSTNPNDQIVLFPDQSDGGSKTIKSTKGTYDECTKIFKIQTQYDGSDWRYEFKRK